MFSFERDIDTVIDDEESTEINVLNEIGNEDSSDEFNDYIWYPSEAISVAFKGKLFCQVEKELSCMIRRKTLRIQVHYWQGQGVKEGLVCLWKLASKPIFAFIWGESARCRS